MLVKIFTYNMFFDAPYYTNHKIMQGMLDVYIKK